MKTVIFDLDGTLCDISHRLHFIRDGDNNWNAFFKACVHDKPKENIIELLKSLQYAEHKILIVSGRSEKVKDQTNDWLHNQSIFYDDLIMRPEGDFTPDHILKKRWLDEEKFGKLEDILFTVDDRDCVVQMWRDAGLTCLQVDRWKEEKK